MDGQYVTEQLCAARRNMDDERFGRDKSRIEKAENRLDDIEKVMHEMSECNTKLTIMVENLSKSNDDHEKRIADIEKKPGANWDKAIAAAIGAVVSYVIGVIISGGV